MGADHAVALSLHTGQAFAASPFFATIRIAVARFRKQGLYLRFDQVTVGGIGFERLYKPPLQNPIHEFKSPAIANCGLPWLAFR